MSMRTDLSCNKNLEANTSKSTTGEKKKLCLVLAIPYPGSDLGRNLLCLERVCLMSGVGRSRSCDVPTLTYSGH